MLRNKFLITKFSQKRGKGVGTRDGTRKGTGIRKLGRASKGTRGETREETSEGNKDLLVCLITRNIITRPGV